MLVKPGLWAVDPGHTHPKWAWFWQAHGRASDSVHAPMLDVGQPRGLFFPQAVATGGTPTRDVDRLGLAARYAGGVTEYHALDMPRPASTTALVMLWAAVVPEFDPSSATFRTAAALQSGGGSGYLVNLGRVYDANDIQVWQNVSTVIASITDSPFGDGEPGFVLFCRRTATDGILLARNLETAELAEDTTLGAGNPTFTPNEFWLADYGIGGDTAWDGTISGGGAMVFQSVADMPTDEQLRDWSLDPFGPYRLYIPPAMVVVAGVEPGDETDGATAGDALGVTAQAPPTDGADAGDTPLPTVQVAPGDGATAGDALSADDVGAITDGADAGDAVGVGVQAALADGATAGEDITTTVEIPGTPEGADAGDSLDATVSSALADGAEAGDLADAGDAGEATDGADAGDSASADVGALAADGADAGDSPLASLAVPLTEGAQAGEDIATTWVQPGAPDIAEAGDALGAVVGVPVSDGAEAGDAATEGQAAATDGADAGDAVAADVLGVAADGARAGDVLASGGEGAVADGALAGDSLSIVLDAILAEIALAGDLAQTEDGGVGLDGALASDAAAVATLRVASTEGALAGDGAVIPAAGAIVATVDAPARTWSVDAP